MAIEPNNDWWSISANNDFDHPSGDFNFGFLFKVSTTNSDSQELFGLYDSGAGADGVRWWVRATDGFLQFSGQFGTTFKAANNQTKDFGDNKWYLVCGGRDGTNVVSRVIEIGTASIATITTTSANTGSNNNVDPMRLGKVFSSAPVNQNTQMDHFFKVHRVVTDDEMKMIAAGSSVMKVLGRDFIWHMDMNKLDAIHPIISTNNSGDAAEQTSGGNAVFVSGPPVLIGFQKPSQIIIETDAAVAGSAPYSFDADYSADGSVIYESNAGYDIDLGYNAVSQVEVGGTVTFAIDQGIGAAALLSAIGSAAFDIATGVSAGSQLDATGAALFGIDAGFDASSQLDAVGTVTFNNELSFNSTGADVIAGTVAFGIESGMDVSALVIFEGSAAYGIAQGVSFISQLLAENNIAFDQVLSVSIGGQNIAEGSADFGTLMDLVAAGSVISAIVTTPSGRTLTVQAISREFNVPASDRTNIVPSVDRTNIIK